MKKIFLLIFCISTFNSFSQSRQKTAYERRKDELTIQMLRQFGITQAQINRANDKDMGGLESLFMLGNFMKKLNTMEGLVAMERFNTALKKAEGLKTEVDFRREREKKALEEKNKQLAIEKANEKDRLENLERVEKQRKEDDADKERQRQEDVRNEEIRKQERYDNSDFVSLKSKIKNQFSKWLDKDEFEKTEDYQNRIKSFGEKIFDSISIKVVTSSLDRLEDKEILNPTLSKYDADNETFTISFSIKDYQWTDIIKIPIKDAAAFKENFGEYKVSTNENSWCFVDNYLYPAKIFFTNPQKNNSLEFTIPLKNKVPIYFTPQSLGFNQAEIKDVFFDYNTYFNKKQTSDSLAFEELFFKTKKQVDNNSFDEATDNIIKAKEIKNDERFTKLENLIPIKRDSLAKLKRIEYLTALVNEYDSLTKIFPQNNIELQKTVFKKYKYLDLAFTYYNEKVVKYLGVTLSQKDKDNYIQSALENDYNEKIIKDGLESVRKIINAQDKLSKMNVDKLKESNSSLKSLKDKDIEFHSEVKRLFED